MKVYHADHGVSEEILTWAVAQAAPGFFARTFTLPEWAEDLLNGLYGPASGDSPVQDGEVFLAQRSADRPLSRMVLRPARPTRLVTVIGVAPEAGGEAVIFTAYGGPLAAREPGDATLPPGSPEHAEAVDFWAKHALASGKPCAHCGGLLSPKTCPGRVWRSGGQNREIPEDFPIETCGTCEEEWLSPDDIGRLSAATPAK